jgi:hypothetical protein
MFRLDHLIKAHLEKLCSDKKATAAFKVTVQILAYVRYGCFGSILDLEKEKRLKC